MTGIEIPEYCGAILLKDVTLFPQGALPLHIFEPRYRTMLEDALESSCMFCVGTLEREESSDPSRCVAPTGTIGLIRASREQEDGRSNLILHGVIRVRFAEWLDTKPYPFARIIPIDQPNVDPAHSEPLVDQLRLAIERALAPFPQEIQDAIRDVVEKARRNPQVLADSIAQQFVRDPSDRRMLLEEADLEKRLRFLVDFLEQATQERDDN